MAKKKNNDIMEMLHALKPGVPTKTRQTPSDDSMKSEKPRAPQQSSSQKPDVMSGKSESALTPKPAASVKSKRIPASVKEKTEKSGKALSLPAIKEVKDVVIMEKEPGLASVITKNMSALEEVRNVLFQEIEKINEIVIDTWTRSMFISFDVAKMNFDYLMELVINAAASLHSNKVDKD